MRKKEEALLRGFLNLYDIRYNSNCVENTDDGEFIVYKDFIHGAYPEFKFNILISSKDICNIMMNTISKYSPFISISRTKALIPSNIKNKYFIITTFYDPSFIELYSFMSGKSATWSNIDSNLLIRTDDIEDSYALNNLIDEEKKKFLFQWDSKANFGKIEKLINTLYTPGENSPGKLIKPFLENDKIDLFSKLKSPVSTILSQLYKEGIGVNLSNFPLTSSILNNLDDNNNYTFGLNDFKYEMLLDENSAFIFSQSCVNLYTQIMNLRSLEINETQIKSLYKTLHIMVKHGNRNSKEAIINQYLNLFRNLGLFQDDNERKMYFILTNPTKFIDKLSAFFDIIKNGIDKFRRDFSYLAPLLNDSLLTDSDLSNITNLLTIFKNLAPNIDPNVKNIDKNLRKFCYPLLIFSLFLGFCQEREYFIKHCDTDGEYQEKMKILTTPVAQRGGIIRDSNSMEENLEILFETLQIEGSKEKLRRGGALFYVEIISVKQKHDLLLEYGKYLEESLQRIKKKFIKI